jgi:phosphodiesterase/alkaline phosphatase D-like protein
MKKNTAVAWGGAGLIVIIGLILYATRNTAPATVIIQTPPTTSADGGQTTVPQPGTPTVATSASVNPTDTTVIVTGSVNPNGAFTNYWYEYGNTASLGTKTTNQSIGSGFATIAAPGYITGLSNDTTYYFRLVAENQYGRFAGTQYSFQTTHGNPPPAGSIPAVQTEAVSGVTRTAVSLNGEVTSNLAATTYWFEFGPTTSLGNTSALVGVSSTGVKVASSVSIGSLTPATTYYYRIDAQNQFGTVNGGILSFKTTGPAIDVSATVTTRSAASVGVTTATLRGTVNPNGTSATYWFEYGTDPQFGQTGLSTTPSTPVSVVTSAVSVSASVSGLATSTTYYYRTAAQNSVGTVHGVSESFTTR